MSESEPKDEKAPRRWPWQKKAEDNYAEKEKPPTVPYKELFRYSSKTDKLYLTVSVICAALHGALLPVLTIIFGSVVDSFGADALGDIERITKWFLILAFIAMALSFVQVRFSMLAANRIGYNIRLRYFNALLRQDPSWFERKPPGELTSVINDVADIEGGVGDKVATATQHLTTFVVGIIVALTYGWKLTLVILAVTPILLASGALIGGLSAEATGEGQGAYAEAGGIANEVLSLIRIVSAYGGQEEEAVRYEKALRKAFKFNVRREFLSGFSLGFVMLCILSIYGLSFFYGAQLERQGEMTAGKMLQVFFAVSIGATAVGQAAPAFKSFAVARGTAPRIFDVIERESPIDPLDEQKGKTLSEVHGAVAFHNVDFAYRNQTPPNDHLPELVFSGFNLDIEKGTSHALVGPSGCGKSTTVKLVERFYDPRAGSVTLDGVDLRELNVKWLRSQIGYVGQMPTLFMLSIRDNIALGAAPVATVDKSSGKRVWELPEVSDEDVVAAAQMANAHDFISRLPEGYDTMLGERGALLSGGQRQRVCIARALVRNPRILILDEATAALDANSERVVQDALDRAAAGRTTITIAHRLSTIRDADRISVVESGAVVEAGTHDELMQTEGGKYRALVDLQNIAGRAADGKVGKDDESALLEDPELAKRRSAHMSLSMKDSTTQMLGELVDEEDLKPTDSGVLRRTFVLNAKEWVFILAGIIGAALSGMSWPMASIPLVKLTKLMIVPGANTVTAVRQWVLTFFGIGCGAFIGHVLHLGALGVSGERLTRKLRTMSFRALLRQEMGYFDKPENSVGALTTRLSREAALVKGVTGDTLGAVTSVIASLASGLIIGFVNCWRVALVVLAIIPGVVIGGYLEMQMSAGLDAGSGKRMSASGRIASEAADNIATVRSLGCENFFNKQFQDSLSALRSGQVRKATVTGIAFGFSEFCQYLIWYAAFEAGVDFVRQGHCDFFELLGSVMGILFAAITLGNVAMFFPDIGESRVAATGIYRLLDRNSAIDPEAPVKGKSAPNKERRGDVVAAKMRFEYPTRPDVAVLRGLSVSVSQGQQLALVGASGCGKSTIVSLLERFYDIRNGALIVDGEAVEDIPVNELRSGLGIVTQDPDLFNRSVRDNIAYGLGHGAAVADSMVTEAAQAANAHDFIMELPEGYDTVVGMRGDKLSGGQRQRVAIARSLIRAPRILLLDEATSALDAVSEKIVQDALDKAAQGRTTITIAHRLSTVRNADIIAVVDKGKVAEQGTHSELLKCGGRYAELVKNQMIEGSKAAD